MALNLQALNKAVTDNTAAVTAAVAVLQKGDPVDQAALDAAAATLAANNATLTAALPTPSSPL